MTFIVGQRWISNTESQLGLGLITELCGRQVSIAFPAAEEERLYAIDNAPLSRIVFNEGEEIVTADHASLTITSVEEADGLLTYSGLDEAGSVVRVSELNLSCFIKLSTPQQRLLSGLLDKLTAFKLRIDTLHHASRLAQSSVQGLLGSRTNHLPHQVYIAHEVAQRFAPRVLLADEVGLGKTIEAGMILHYQRHTGRANRILIVVPDTLLHQWLVEMLRRFNLRFSIIDQSRFERMDEESEDLPDDLEPITQGNPFETETLVLCSLDFLMKNKEAHAQAMACEWDLLVVDEAHHLHRSAESVSPQYACIESLSAQSKGLLLLTATPEQVGIESHFARLRLLDPSRFYDFSVFKKEEENYKSINELVQRLIIEDTLSPALQSELTAYLGDNTTTDRSQAIKQLLDRHGTGRILFRNTRAAIQGFPERALHAYPLPCPSIYASLTQDTLHPEITVSVDEWLAQDPRVTWLIDQIEALSPSKILVICAQATTAIKLEQHIKLKTNIRTSAFHEGLSIIERDRAAAYFAEAQQGAQALICSEIGSEGRNFQFAHHLVLFDLPLNPDLLEQRIGRLDRIGQEQTIQIHVPYLENTAQENLFLWYHKGINLFEKSCSVGFSIYEAFEDRLLPLLSSTPCEQNTILLDALIKDTQQHTQAIIQALHEGRDKLLEMNSCNPLIAQDLIQTIEAEENSTVLENYMAEVFHQFAVDHEYHSPNCEILHPTDHMPTSHFPELKEDGVTVTYSRSKALMREDMIFLSWEHPMVMESMEMILDGEVGNTTLTTISIKSINPGTLFVESFFTINCAAPKHLQLDRYLPLTPIRVLMDITGKNLSAVLSYQQLNDLCEPVKRHLGYSIIKQVRDDLASILKLTNNVATQQMAQVIQEAKSQMHASLRIEVDRLLALKKINPSIREDEITYFNKKITDSDFFIDCAELKLQAIRVVVNK